jgi:hypothetical protein
LSYKRSRGSTRASQEDSKKEERNLSEERTVTALPFVHAPLFLALSMVGCTLGNLLWEGLQPIGMEPAMVVGETAREQGTMLETVLAGLIALAFGCIADWFSAPLVLLLVSVCLGTALLLSFWEMKGWLFANRAGTVEG